MYAGFWWGDLAVDGRIILKLIFRKWDGDAVTQDRHR